MELPRLGPAQACALPVGCLTVNAPVSGDSRRTHAIGYGQRVVDSKTLKIGWSNKGCSLGALRRHHQPNPIVATWCLEPRSTDAALNLARRKVIGTGNAIGMTGNRLGYQHDRK